MHANRNNLLFSIVLALAWPAVVQAGPRVTCDKPHHDFGQVHNRQAVSHTYVVTNAGDTNLVISRIRSSCRCVVAGKGERVVAPGEKTEISVKYDLKGLRGKHRKTIYLHTNDPGAPYYRLSFALDIRQEVNVRPDTVFFGQVGDDYTPVTRSVQIEADHEATVNVTGIETNEAGFFTAAVETLTAGSKYRILFELPAGSLTKTGIYKGSVFVLTDHPSYRRVRIPVTAMMRKDILVTPRTLNMRKAGGSQTRYFMARSTAKHDVEQVRVEVLPSQEATVERLSPSEFRIKISNIKATEELRGKELRFHVKLKSGKMETIVVPITVM